MSNEPTLLSALVRFPEAIWEVYTPEGTLVYFKTSSGMLDLLVSTPEFLKTFPHDLPIRWGEDGSVMVQLGEKPWTRFLRLREKGALEMTGEQAREFIENAAEGKEVDHPDVDRLLDELASQRAGESRQ